MNYGVIKQCLSSLQGLSMVLSRSHVDDDFEDESMETEKNEYTELMMSHVWLLEHLPKIAHFESVREQVCAALRTVNN